MRSMSLALTTNPWLTTAMWIVCLTMTSIAAAQQSGVETFRRGGRSSKTEVSQTEDGRPKIRYGSSRSSSRWVSTKNGARVAVDEGIEWKERKYYIALTYRLVAVPSGEETADWSRSVSAFWDQLSIGDFQRDGGNKVEALTLRSSRKPDFVEYRSLVTGERIGGSQSSPPGEQIKLAGSWKGNRAHRDEPTYELVRSVEAWHQLHDSMFKGLPGSPPRDLSPDFSEFVIVVLCRGKSSNCNGYTAVAYRDKDRVVLRAHALTYQSMGETPDTWPYGVFVVPVSRGGQPSNQGESATELVVERNVQGYIGGPEIWKEWKKWSLK